jgi:MFS family permease
MILKLERSTTRVLGLLCIMYFITYIDRVNVSTAASEFGKEFGFSHTQIGFIFSAFAYPYLLFQVIGGWVGDRFGPRWTLTVCGIVWAGATILMGLSGGFYSMVIARILLGFGEGATFPTATKAMSDWVVKGRRGFAQGITHAFSRIGNAITPPVVTWLMIAYSWRMSFIIIGIISMIWALIWVYYFRNNPKDHPNITKEELDELPVYVEKKDAPVIPWLALFKRMAPVTIVYFCYGWTLWLFLSWIPQYFLHNFKLDLKSTSYFAATVFLAGVLGDYFGGNITDWLYKKTQNLNKARSLMVAICNLATLVSLLPILFVPDVTVAVICLSLGFFFAEMTIGPMWAIPMDIAPKFSGTASGMMNTGSALAAIISPVIGGMIIDYTGNWNLIFVGSMILMIVGALLAFTMKPSEKFS